MKILRREGEKKLSELKRDSLHSQLQRDPDHAAFEKTITAIIGGDQSLEGHLQTVFSFLVDHYPNNALEKLEEVSWLLKKKD
jgi:hypothetical protein